MYKWRSFLARLLWLLDTTYTSTMYTRHALVENTKSVVEIFKPRLLEKGWAFTYEKCLFLLDKDFLVKEMINPTSKLHLKKDVPPIYRIPLRMLYFLGWTVNFPGLSNCSLFRALCSVNERRKYGNSLILVPFDKNGLRLLFCEIWRWVINLGFER